MIKERERAGERERERAREREGDFSQGESETPEKMCEQVFLRKNLKFLKNLASFSAQSSHCVRPNEQAAIKKTQMEVLAAAREQLLEVQRRQASLVPRATGGLSPAVSP